MELISFGIRDYFDQNMIVENDIEYPQKIKSGTPFWSSSSTSENNIS